MQPFMAVIHGEPIPQGSKTIAKAGNKVWLRDANPKLAAWRKSVSEQVLAERIRMNHEPFKQHQAVSVTILFHLAKPKSVTREWPTVKPDLDKLIRAVFDGCTDANLWYDDSQVVTVNASMVYCAPGDTPNVMMNVFAKKSLLPLN